MADSGPKRLVEILGGLGADPLRARIERARKALPSDRLVALVKRHLIEADVPSEDFDLIDSIRKVRDILCED